MNQSELRNVTYAGYDRTVFLAQEGLSLLDVSHADPSVNLHLLQKSEGCRYMKVQLYSRLRWNSSTSAAKQRKHYFAY